MHFKQSVCAHLLEIPLKEVPKVCKNHDKHHFLQKLAYAVELRKEHFVLLAFHDPLLYKVGLTEEVD